MTNPTTQDLRTTTERELIQRLADELDHYKQLLMDDRREVHALATEARAYLAQPEPEGPTDADLLELMPQQMQDDFAFAARAMAQQAGTAAGVFRVGLNTDALEYTRAALARWGTR